MAAVQSYRNHARFDPPFHFIAAPILLVNLIITIVVLIHTWPNRLLLHSWLVILAFGLLMTAGVARSSALRAQDRLIRLEEKMRYQRLLSRDELTTTEKLRVEQIVALRFASDGELPGLVGRALAERMEPKAIKQAITEWKPDLYRV